MLGIYCRISQDKDVGENRSITNQKELGISKAQELNLSYKIYTDEGISGTLDEIEDRPGLYDLINDINSNEISAVFVTDQDRLERNPKMGYILKDIFRKNNVKFYTSNQEVDLFDPNVEFVSSITSLVNGFYVNLTKTKIKRVLSHRAKTGKAHGVLPYGYHTNEQGFLKVHKDQSLVVQRIFKMSLEGIGTDRIARILNKENIPTRYNYYGEGSITVIDKNDKTVKKTIQKKDIKWAGKTVQGIIKNKIYTGLRTFGGQTFECPAIISVDHWRKVNENLKKNRNNQGKIVEHKYMLKGKLKCGRCGRNMYGRSRVNKKDNAYICSSKRYPEEKCNSRGINIDVLENFVWEQFFEKKELLDNVKSHFKDYHDNREQFQKELESLNSEKGRLDKEKTNSIRLAIKGHIEEKDIKPELLRIENQTKELNFQILKKEEQLRELQNRDEVINEVRNSVELAQVQNVPWNDRKDLVRKYVREIQIHWDDDSHYLIDVAFNPSIKYPLVYVMDWQKREPYVDLLKAWEIRDFSYQWKVANGRLDELRKKADEWLHEKSMDFPDIYNH